MKTTPKLLLLTMAAALFTVLLAACGSDDPTAAPTATSAPATATPTLAPGETPQPTPVPPTATPEPAFDAAGVFGGKTVHLITGTSPGGGYDTILRIFARVAPKYFPEGTRFVVQNLPGGSQLRGLQEVMRSEPDGLTAGPTHPRWFQRALLFNDVEGFDLSKVEIIGSPTFRRNPNMLCIDSSIATSWEEVLALGRDITVGEVGPGNAPGPQFLEELGAPIKNVYGYGGTSEVMAAFDRGEIDATSRCGPETVERLFPEWVTDGRLAPLFWYEAEFDDDWLTKLGVTRDQVPHALDVSGITVTEADRSAFEGFVMMVLFQRTFVLPEGVPAEVVSYWRDAFQQIANDPEFVEFVDIAGYTDQYGVALGDEIQQAMDELLALPADVIETLKKFAPE